MKTQISNFFEKYHLKIAVIFLLLNSIGAFIYYYRNGLGLAYNDSMAHLDISRQVIDNINPGFYQLGSVWLPLNHILSLSLIWNNWAWHSGFAGAFFSMLSYIASSIVVYWIVKSVTNNSLASVVALFVFALNLNILYLQSTALTEPLYVALFLLSVYFFVLWLKNNNNKYLILMGLFGFLQVLTRYDGWFVIGCEALLVAYADLFIFKSKLRQVMGKIILFAFPIMLGLSLWIFWNLLIFNDPLYFILGPYSAHAQQSHIGSISGLITKGNIRLSMLSYWYAMKDNVGVFILALAFLGLGSFFIGKKIALKFQSKFLLVVFLSSPIIFNIIALYFGFSILNMPELNWMPGGHISDLYFNVRYGILALPLVAVLVGIFVNNKKYFAILAIVIVFAQGYIFLRKEGIITVIDGTIGSSSFANEDVSSQLSLLVSGNDKILLSMSHFNPVAFRSGFSLKQFIHEGDSGVWEKALVAPEDYAKFIVMPNGDVGEALYTSLVEKNKNNFLDFYSLVYRGKHANIFKLKDESELFIKKNGASLLLGKNIFLPKGVNSYDLAYKSTQQIDNALKNLSELGVNTVRFWLFGDGNEDGFQPQVGVMNEDRFENADYLIAQATKYNIRLIPVLLNNWTDYGGEQQYLKWIGVGPNNQEAFYTNPKAMQLFENYINHVLSRKNTVNGLAYSEDPTIMAWEIINEPRFSADNDSQVFVQWFSEITNYIKQQDSNHLITVETDTNFVNQNRQLEVRNLCGALLVDICSAHIYLNIEGRDVYADKNEVESNLQQYIKVTNEDDKPFILGEIGVSKATLPFNEKPLGVLNDILSSSKGVGALIWNWSDKSDDSYGFSEFGYGDKGEYNKNDLKRLIRW